MHNFKKILLSMSSVILIFSLISGIIITPFLNSENSYFQDSSLRAKLAGKINFVIIGASNSLNAYQPQVLDKNLGCCSYNLSGSMMKITDRTYFLEKEFERNPIKTVVLDLSHDSLLRDESNEYAVCEEASFGRLDSSSERLSYLIHHVQFDDWLNLYSREFVAGLHYWMKMLTHQSTSNVDYAAKGYQNKSVNDLSFTQHEALQRYNESIYSENFRPENIKEFSEMIQLCKAHGARVIVTVVPVPDSVIWCTDNWDSFYQWSQNFCKKNGCEFYDMNLLRNRYDLFNDHESFTDTIHMSGNGASVYTGAFSHIIDLAEHMDVSDYFYDSYTEMKADSPYMKYLN